MSSPSETKAPATLLEYALRVLSTSDASEKARLTLQAHDKWTQGELPIGDLHTTPMPADRPARPVHLVTVAPSEVPGKAKGPDANMESRLRG